MRWIELVYTGDVAHGDGNVDRAPRIQVRGDDGAVLCAVDVLLSAESLDAPRGAADRDVRSALVRFVAPGVEVAVREGRVIAPGRVCTARVCDGGEDEGAMRYSARRFAAFLLQSSGQPPVEPGQVVAAFYVGDPDAAA